MKKLVLATVVLLQVTLMIDCLLAQKIWQTSISAFVTIWLLYLLFNSLFAKMEKREGGEKDKSKEQDKTLKDDKSYFEQYIENIGEKIGKESAERVRTDVEAIIGSDTQGRIDEILSRPKRTRAKGLVVGRVQSGKTINFTGVITRAVDKGWNTIIVLTSNNTALEQQTIRRLRKDLSDCGLTEDKYVLIDSFVKPNIPKLHDLEPGKVYVGFALKQVDHLRGRDDNGKGVIGWLQSCGESVEKANVIIIDDESDNSTQNTVQGPADWSEQSVLDYAQHVKKEGKENNEDGIVRVSEWIYDLVEKVEKVEENINFTNANEQQIESLKNILKNRTGEDEVGHIIDNYSELLGLNRTVPYGQHEIPTLLGGHVKNYFTKRATTGRRGHSRGDDFRAILRWFLDVRKERSEVNKAVMMLVSDETFHFAKLAYIGYTASPYANFLNEPLGADNPLELDFAQSTSVAPEYFGLVKIFGKNFDSLNPRMPIVKDIPDSERKDITEPLMADVDVRLDKELNYNYRDKDGKQRQGSWNSLRDAIKWAIAAAAIRRGNRIGKYVPETGEDSRSKRWTTMLVNLSRKIDNHAGLRDVIQKYLAHSLENASRFKNECLAVFDATVGDIDEKHFHELFPDYPHVVKNLDRKSVEQHIDYVLEHFRVIALNSDTLNEDAYNEYVQNVHDGQKLAGDWLWIVIGGNRISRGLTFDGLVSSYFDRDGISVNVDTLLQMGRWFGYRVGYELLPRVWMPAGTVKSMKEICKLEEDLHSQLHTSFENHENKPNPKMLAIARRLTGRDNGIVHENGVENPVITREFVVPSKGSKYGVELVSDFLAQCGECKTQGDDEPGKIYTRLKVWESVDLERIKTFFESLSSLYAEYDSLTVALEVMKSMGQSADVVLSDPQNRGEVVRLIGIDCEPHIHGIGSGERLEAERVRFGRFSGQYDAWKAVIPPDIVKDIENKFGVRANKNEAIAEMFAQKAARGHKVRPVVQIGFVKVDEIPTPYISVYCPEMEELKIATVTAGNVLDNFGVHHDTVSPIHATNVQDDAYSLATELEQALKDKEYIPAKDLSAAAKNILREVSDKRSEMPSGYGYWLDNRSAYGNGRAVFKDSYAKEANEFIDKIKQEATEAVADYLKNHTTEVFAARDLWRESTNGKYNGILEPNGKHILPARIDDAEVSQLKKYGIVCIPNGQNRPKIRYGERT